MQSEKQKWRKLSVRVACQLVIGFLAIVNRLFETIQNESMIGKQVNQRRNGSVKILVWRGLAVDTNSLEMMGLRVVENLN